MDKNPTAAQDKKPIEFQTNPASALLSETLSQVMEPVNNLLQIGRRHKSSNIKCVARLIETSLKNSTPDNPIPYLVDPKKAEHSVAAERSVTLDKADRGSVFQNIHSIMKVLKESYKKSSGFEETVIGFLQMVCIEFETRPVEIFQMNKGEMIAMFQEMAQQGSVAPN